MSCYKCWQLFLIVWVCFLQAFCTRTIPESGLEHHNLDSVSARLHIILSFLRGSLGRTCIWFEEDPSRAVPRRSLYYVGRCFATSCHCYFAAGVATCNSTYFITCYFFKIASLSFHLLDKYLCFYRESVCAQQAVSFGLRHLVILGLCDLSRDYHSVLLSYISSPKCVTSQRGVKWLTSLLITFIDYIPFVRFVRLPATVFFW